MKVPITPREKNNLLGDRLSVQTAGTARATIKVGNVYSGEGIDLLDGELKGVLISHESLGRKRQSELNWKDH